MAKKFKTKYNININNFNIEELKNNVKKGSKYGIKLLKIVNLKNQILTKINSQINKEEIL